MDSLPLFVDLAAQGSIVVSGRCNLVLCLKKDMEMGMPDKQHFHSKLIIAIDA